MSQDLHVPDHMSVDNAAWYLWVAASIALGISVLVPSLAVAPLGWWLAGRPLDETALQGIAAYLGQLPDPDFVLRAYNQIWHQHWSAGFQVTTLPLVAGILVAGIGYAANPFPPFAMKYGDVRWAKDADIRIMENRRQVGIRGARIGVLGRWRDGGLIRLIEPLSIAVAAPPGAGKTAGLVVPSIVMSDDVSLIINDVKPELAEMTSGWRSQVSVTIILNWSEVDDPASGIFWPRINFLDPRLVPPAGAQRDTYLESLAKILIPDSKGSQKFWSDKGRDLLVGLLHAFIVLINDQRSYDTLPPEHHGRDASFPMLVDWLTHLESATEDRLQASGDRPGGNAQIDAKKLFVLDIIKRVQPYSNRAITSLMPVVNLADQTRSSIFSQVDQALLPFKNTAIYERCSGSDFLPSDLRGMRCPKTGEWLPVTLYVCSRQSEAGAYSTITALLYEVLARELITYGPNEETTTPGPDGGRIRMGPKNVVFVLDEFAKLPRSEAVLRGPDLGRSKGTAFHLYYQARAQIALTYSKEDMEVIDSTTSVKIAFPQNDTATIDYFVKMVGTTTIQSKSRSQTQGLSKQVNPFAANVSISTEKVNFLRPDDISSMKPGEHIVIAQNFFNRPMRVKTPFYFQDKAVAQRVFNPRTRQGPAPAAPLPRDLMDARRRDLERAARLSEDAVLASQATRAAALRSNENLEAADD